MPDTATKTPTADCQGWPEDLSFKAFKKVSLATEDWVYKTVYALRTEQIKIQNERIALIKLRQILRATFKLTASVGFHSMSLRELSRESGISMGGLYAYIGSKEELANLIEYVLNAIATELTDRALVGISDTKTQLATLICSHVYLSEQLQPWFYFVFMESKSLSKPQKEKAKQTEIEFEKRISKLLQQGINEGTFQPVDVNLTSSALMAMLQDWHLKRWKHRNRKVTPDQYARFLLNLFLGQLGVAHVEASLGKA